jgi:flagellar biosynthetic protein FliR
VRLEGLGDILGHVPALLLVVFRIGGLMIFGPIFGSSVIPARLKVLLALVLGMAIYPLVGPPDPALSLSVWSMAPAIATELMIGLIIGFLAALPLVAVQVGGLMMSQQMGLGFARFVDPALDVEVDVVGQVLFVLTLAGFLLIGGHEAMVLAVLNSFEHLPVPAWGSFAPDLDLLAVSAGLLGATLEVALRVATPVLALLFLQTVAMGFIARTVPQMNILSLGFPLRILGGLAVISLGLVVIDEVVMELVDEGLNVILAWVEG